MQPPISPAAPSRTPPLPRRLAAWAALVGCCAAAPALAQPATLASPTARGAQYVFVIDDSGSMEREVGGHPAADPDRLAIFAVRSLLAMLDEEDEAALVRLNARGDAPRIAPLGERGEQLARRLALDGDLARYAGEITPCRTALERVKRALERAYRDGMPQVVFFLTDGECTPRGSERPRVESFLSGLPSHRHGLLRFYLLRFAGRPSSSELAQLARATGGQAIEVDADDPAGLLEPFADALTRSQGYEAELVTPTDPQLAAHRGARRVRLLAVAPGEGPPLGLEVSSPGGSAPRPLGRVRRGTHRYGAGRTYRYAALDYRPGDDPVRLAVEGARDWKVVAVPEYRLAVEMELAEGSCEQASTTVRHAVETGSTLCARIRLVNEEGRPVSRRAGGGGVQAHVLYGHRLDELTPLPADPRGERAEFAFQRSRIEPGDHVFQPLVSLRMPGRDEPLELRGPARAVQASSLEIRPETSSFDFGQLLPGAIGAPEPLVLTGNFPPAVARLEMVNREAVPSCLTFTLAGEREGEAVRIEPGQPYSLAPHVAPYCGPTSFRRRYEPVLRLVLDAVGESVELPAVEVVADVALDYRIEVSPRIEASLVAGERPRLPLSLGTNAVRPMELDAHLVPAEERRGWPGADRLDVGFAGGSGAEASSRTLSIPADRATATLPLVVTSDRCAPSGTYETTILLAPPPDAVYSGEPPDFVRVPVVLVVESAGTWACWGDRVLAALGILLLALLLFYLVSMIRHSRWLDRDLLAEKLVPLVWDRHGEPLRRSRDQEEVRALVRRSLPLGRRALAWVRANPLVFGLPGKRYEETVELELLPRRGIDRSSLRLIPDRNLYRRMQERPEDWKGRLFARAQGRGAVSFFGVPDRGRFSRLAAERLGGGFAAAGHDRSREAEVKSKLFRLKRKEQLIHLDGERREGAAAGWQVG